MPGGGLHRGPNHEPTVVWARVEGRDAGGESPREMRNAPSVSPEYQVPPRGITPANREKAASAKVREGNTTPPRTMLEALPGIPPIGA